MPEATIGEVVDKDPVPLMRNAKKLQVLDIPVANPDLIVGLELEIENVGGDVPLHFAGVNFTEDGSLRNGWEGVTEPLYTKHVQDLLSRFFNHFKINEEDNYSDRCSLHVHVNVTDLTWDQLASVALLYQVFERGLFTYIGQNRDSNIFCVPWCQANGNVNLVNTIRSRNVYSLRNWAKYTALNLLPIVQKGSVEFRHMHGTCNVPRIIEWLNLIGCMFKYGAATKVGDLQETICELNTSSAYDVFIRNVFGEYSGVLLSQEGFSFAMEQGVIDCKLMLTNPEGLLYGIVKPNGDPRPVPPEADNLDALHHYIMGQHRIDGANAARIDVVNLWDANLAVPPQPVVNRLPQQNPRPAAGRNNRR